MPAPDWLRWARQLQTLAQTGLAYPKDPFDVERYHRILDVAAEMMAAGSGEDVTKVRELFAAETGHATPKVDVRGAVVRDGEVLFVKERSSGLWTLPGGWADVGESAAESVVREVWEESGYRTRAVKLLAVYDRDRHPHPPMPFHAYKLFFLCELVEEGALPPNLETDEVAFFPEDRPPELDLARVTPDELARVWAHVRDPALPTDFD